MNVSVHDLTDMEKLDLWLKQLASEGIEVMEARVKLTSGTVVRTALENDSLMIAVES